ncbi:MAG: hypothetical protein ABIR16_07050 [Dokdonella sp.]
MKFLISGTAGSIRSHLDLKLLACGEHAVRADNQSDYYDLNLEKARLERLQTTPTTPASTRNGLTARRSRRY